MLIDTHVHVISADTSGYPLRYGDPKATFYSETPVPVETFIPLMQEARVDRAILVQCYSAYKYDNSYTVDCAAAHPDLFSSVVIVDPVRDPGATLEYWVRERSTHGVRLLIQAPDRDASAPGSAVSRGTCDAWRKAIELGIPVSVNMSFRQGHGSWFRQALHEFPGCSVVLDHCGYPDLSGKRPFEKAAELLSLAKFGGVLLKVTSRMLKEVDEQGGSASAVVDALAAEFGAARLMWGSDYCATHDVPYERLVQIARTASAGLPAADRLAFLGGTARLVWPRLSVERQARKTQS